MSALATTPPAAVLPPTVRLVSRVRTPLWTDVPVTGETPVKAIHVDELRRAIDAQRARSGLASFAWTDDPIVSWQTVIKAQHFLELRAAIQDVWTARGFGALPPWTAGSPPAEQRIIFASDVNDLRQWTEVQTAAAPSR